MEYFAHIAKDGRAQTVKQHLNGTADLCAKFASVFDSEEHGRLVGLSHDIGKYSEAFQARLHGGQIIDHATAGAIECVKIDCLFDACAVVGHHSGLPDFGNINVDQPGDFTFCGRLKNGINGGIAPYVFNDKLPVPKNLPVSSKDLLSLSFWIRMLYSCLVDADYLDTYCFMSGKSGITVNYDSMQDLYKLLIKYIESFWPPSNDINAQRCKVLKACIDSSTMDKGIFTLTVPTGGGKTIASLAFAIEHALAHHMDRIIYVIPYTSIIEQNAGYFKDILGEKNVLEHHSNMIFDSPDAASDTNSKKYRITENWDSPIVVTTAVQFFESMYANSASKCRKLHNIANSVIIFDEAQMIPVEHLKPCVAAIGNLVSHFGATAVLCTATQPVLNDILTTYAPDYPIREIYPDTKELYNHFKRVTFRQIGKLSTLALAENLSQLKQVLCIVNSRKSAQEVFKLLPPEGRFHLSTLMCPAHREEVLKTIRRCLSSPDSVNIPCRVVSTSLIEAGIDIDFPAVYREKAGLDSILQAAGRCNREGKASAADSIVSIFEGENPIPPLFKVNIGACTEALQNGADPASPETVKKYFNSLRSLIGDDIDISGAVSAMSNGISGCYMPFKTVARDFHMIDSDTKTVYICFGEGSQFIQKIVDGSATLNDYRSAGRYSVSIFDRHYQALLDAGAIKEIDDNNAVLVDMSLYSYETGLALNADTGKNSFG